MKLPKGKANQPLPPVKPRPMGISGPVNTTTKLWEKELKKAYKWINEVNKGGGIK